MLPHEYPELVALRTAAQLRETIDRLETEAQLLENVARQHGHPIYTTPDGQNREVLGYQPITANVEWLNHEGQPVSSGTAYPGWAYVLVPRQPEPQPEETQQ